MEKTIENYPFELDKDEFALIHTDLKKIQDYDSTLDIRKVITELDKTDSAVKCPLSYNFFKSLYDHDIICGITELQFFDIISDAININEDQQLLQDINEKENNKKIAENFFESFLDLENLGYITKDKFTLIWNASSIGRLYDKPGIKKLDELFFPSSLVSDSKETFSHEVRLTKEKFVEVFEKIQGQ